MILITGKPAQNQLFSGTDQLLFEDYHRKNLHEQSENPEGSHQRFPKRTSACKQIHPHSSCLQDRPQPTDSLLQWRNRQPGHRYAARLFHPAHHTQPSIKCHLRESVLVNTLSGTFVKVPKWVLVSPRELNYLRTCFIAKQHSVSVTLIHSHQIEPVMHRPFNVDEHGTIVKATTVITLYINYESEFIVLEWRPFRRAQRIRRRSKRLRRRR